MMTEWQAGLVAFREGRMREAVDRLQNAVRETDNAVSQAARFQTYAFLGAALYSLGQAADAVGAFETALRLNPAKSPPPDLTVNLANAYLAAGRRDDAVRLLQQTLQFAPGHIEARMLLQRLAAQTDTNARGGMVLGASPQSVKQFLRSLVFKTVPTGGYDPAQVRQAFLQMERYTDFLIAQIAHSERVIAQNQQEMARLQQSEDALVENMLRAQKEAETLREELSKSAPTSAAAEVDPNAPELSPLERLFQRKN